MLRIEKREGGEGVRVCIDSAVTWAAVARGIRPDAFTIADPPPPSLVGGASGTDGVSSEPTRKGQLCWRPNTPSRS